TIYEIVRQGKMSMSSVVDDWIDAYKADRNGALLDLIQFFIHASGCKGTITPQMMQEVSEGFQDVIKQMTEQFDEDSGDYPLIAAGAYFRKFRSSFCDFVQALVRQCQYEIIYDQYMMDNILTLLTELSNSQVRAFRHTSTLAAMKLMTGLVNVALQLSVSLDNTQRQYDAEHSKSLSKRASEKLDILMQKKKELEEQQSEIEGMLNGIFKGIFVHRYRDFIAEIRALCMDEIGAWMKMFPKVFLTDSYLKYVGWTLHDKQKEVRAKCLNSLIGLYGDNEMTRDLKLFTSRFKDRIVSMTLDKEYDVAVQAIKLLHLILSNCGYDTPVLTSSDSERVYQLVFSCHRPVAVAAADFLNKQLFINKVSFEENVICPGWKRRGVNAPLITDLVLFFIESERLRKDGNIFNSALMIVNNSNKIWEQFYSKVWYHECYYWHYPIFTHFFTKIIEVIKAESSQKTASRDRKIAIEDRLRLTEHFMVALPNLLKKFHVDREKVVGLLQIPRYFELECYTTSRREKHLDDLLAQLSVIVDKHTDPDVLEQVSRTYSHLCDDEFAIFNKVSISRRAVIDKWAENFRFALAIFKDAEDNVDEEEIYNVVQNLKRLTHLYMFNDLTQWDLYPKANSIIEMHQERPDTIPQAMLLQTVKFIYYHLLYSLAGLKNGGAKSYMSICDLLVIFAPQLAHSSPNLKSLVQRPSEPVQHSLVDFVREFLFRDTVREQGGVLDQSSQEYGHMKELARRFALTFGLDQVKTRDAVAELHREGIVFALKRDESMFNETEPPANLTFLGILVEFSAKLMKQDKRTVLQYLDKHISPHQLSNQESLWIPLVTYRNSLLQGAGMDDDARPTAGKVS
uniref:SCD domain-containing protein n=1 Tax=Ciona savignyi TaxID=51511 RepID=H2YHP8_CIOSA